MISIYKISFFLIIIKLKIVKLTTISIVSSFYKKIEKFFIKLFIMMKQLFFERILEMGWSGAIAKKLAPNMVSGLVV